MNKKELDEKIDKIIDETNYFSIIDFFKKDRKKLLMVILSSFLFAFATTSLLTKAASIPTGLSSISMTFSFILPIVKPYLNFIYLGLNIPLFLIFWKKVKKSYVYTTLTFLICNAIFGFFIGFDFANNGKGSFDYLVSQNVLIFCPPNNEREWAYARANNIKNVVSVSVNDFNQWLKDNWYKNNNVSGYLDPISNALTLGVEKGWPIFIYSLSAVVLASSAGAISWKSGGSTGGTDIIAYYYSVKQKKPIGTILMIIGILMVTISLFVLWSLSSWAPNSISKNINGFQSLISLQTLASFIYVVLYGKILNMIYPKYSKVVVKIDTLNIELIKEYFARSKFNHPYKIHTLTSGKTNKNIYTFETVVLLLEVEDLIMNIKKVDPSAWVSRSSVQKIYGAFDYSGVE